ncbi:MAG: hypothetical protein EON91_06870 [Brevundimonas sp.]|uniref:hypothetical protein n=1 Tax=Brevundimonas sp. TaxID=1871086 RepID=UPI0012257F23|nr:hypothetical protein [Brevundimonas sp.]RZJ18050.1 MAG: hypothetical protein EON91_06870 [Brevundimonas sp.]
MKPTRLIAVLLCSAMLPCAALAQDPPTAAETAARAIAQDAAATAGSASDKFEIARSGDEALSCDALTTEINALNIQAFAIAEGVPLQGATQPQPQRRGLGSMLSLGSIAAAFIPGAGLAVGAAQMLATADQAGGLMSNIQNVLGQGEAGQLRNLEKRMDHLKAIAKNKSC